MCPEQLTITDDAVQAIIHAYTWEAGLRNLERKIGAICRGLAREIVDDQAEAVVVKETSLAHYFSPIKFFSEVAERPVQPGVATRLVWTPVGGDVLFVESTKMKGHEKLILTGQLGNVMKESAKIALSYVRSQADKLGLAEDFSVDTDVHMHVPSGAIPKGRPSAGVTLYTSLVSLFTDKPVRSDVAMTGEVTLRGSVLPVGALRNQNLCPRSVKLPAFSGIGNFEKLPGITIHSDHNPSTSICAGNGSPAAPLFSSEFLASCHITLWPESG